MLLLRNITLNSSFGPVFILYLDAKSAFDVVLKELLVMNLYFAGTHGETLLYLNARLENR